MLPPSVTGLHRIYVAGPMSGLPQMNFPAFDDAAETLRDIGYDVVSPAELDSPQARACALASVDGSTDDYAEGDTWGSLLARDVKLIADEGIEGIVVLEGWEKSRGARLETFVARLCGLRVIEYPSLTDVSDSAIDTAHASEHVAAVQQAGEVEVVNEKTGGRKGQKVEQYNLLPWAELGEVARLYAAGSQKYEPHNWTKGYDWSLSFDSLIRHVTQFWMGEEQDVETECSHLASVVFHALALLYFSTHHRDLDNRPQIPRVFEELPF